jgi:hypothetical protein
MWLLRLIKVMRAPHFREIVVCELTLSVVIDGFIDGLLGEKPALVAVRCISAAQADERCTRPANGAGPRVLPWRPTARGGRSEQVLVGTSRRSAHCRAALAFRGFANRDVYRS